MRKLVLMRGAMGSGKSTWLKNNNLEQYTLSADKIRLMCQSPILLTDGNVGISQSNDNLVWKMLFQFLETRMSKGEFVIIDACNTKTSEMNRYKKLAERYRYHIFCIDMTDVPIEVAKARNFNRSKHQQVSEQIIDNAYSRFETQKIPSGIKVIKPDEFQEVVQFNPIDLSNYKKISIIGDIHGCYSVLMNYLSGDYSNKEKVLKNISLNEDTMYIFVGDYIDRGLENAEIMNFLFSIMNNKNVIFLEGNHERWLWEWSNDRQGRSKEFETITRIQLEDNNIDKKQTRIFYRKLRQLAYFTYYNKTLIVTHGGISDIPENLTYIATEQFIKGVGNYKDALDVDNYFVKNTNDDYYQIHGHRNIDGIPTKANERCFNLVGEVEFGGDLRIVEFDKDNVNTIEVKNHIFKETCKKDIAELETNNMLDVMIKLRNNRGIKEKRFGEISSFNFTKQVFYDKKWDEQTVTARGLYLNNRTGEMVLRGYPKFFNVNERQETKLDNLKNTLKFPVDIYVKYNGYLGLLSTYNDELIFATKSSIDGDYAEWFKQIFYNKFGNEQVDKIKKELKDLKSTMIFEVIAYEKDPHIIEYKEDDLILLDIIKNDISFSKLNYEDLTQKALKLSMDYKQKAIQISNWKEFYDWYTEVMKDGYLYQSTNSENKTVVEGFVIEDADGFMTKLKLTYYNFWKFMRGIKDEVNRKGYTSRTSALTTPLANDFYSWLKDIYNTDREYLKNNIVELRRKYYETYYKR